MDGYTNMKPNLKIKVIVYEKDGVHHFIEKVFDIKSGSLEDFLKQVETLKSRFNPYN